MISLQSNNCYCLQPRLIIIIYDKNSNHASHVLRTKSARENLSISAHASHVTDVATAGVCLSKKVMMKLTEFNVCYFTSEPQQ